VYLFFNELCFTSSISIALHVQSLFVNIKVLASIAGVYNFRSTHHDLCCILKYNILQKDSCPRVLIFQSLGIQVMQQRQVFQ
jgi:hypothetical protein